MLFLRVVEPFYAAPKPAAAPPAAPEDAVDAALRRESGRISRGRDPHYCQHGPRGMCSHCQPLEPWDAAYQQERGIKHLSFHAHLRRLAAGAQHPAPGLVEEAEYGVRARCAGHPPYPEGICTKCQPSAIVLQQQPFRMVDHVEFEAPAVVEPVLAAWRRSGHQHFGWLLGRYAVYDGVPLGIKAVVSAVWMPPQDGSVDGFQLLPAAAGTDAHVQAVAADLGLAVVGMLYTDLADDGSRSGRVLARRSAATFFVSSGEALFMAAQQLAHPSRCAASRSGVFSSKFVTVVATGNEDAEVALLAYQVSNTAEALVRSALLEATTDPSLVMVRESVPGTLYVPEVMYKLADEYGNTVQRTADPFFPVEYLLVTLSHGFPVQQDPLFRSAAPFPPALEQPTAATLRAYMAADADAPLSAALSNFDLLVFLHAHLGADTCRAICRAVAARDDSALAGLTAESTAWNSMLAIAAPAAGAADWCCPHCTFLNVDRPPEACEMCGLPRS